MTHEALVALRVLCPTWIACTAVFVTRVIGCQEVRRDGIITACRAAVATRGPYVFTMKVFQNIASTMSYDSVTGHLHFMLSCTVRACFKCNDIHGGLSAYKRSQYNP